MPFRPIPTPPPPSEIGLDTPDMVEAAAFVESGEAHLRMLSRLAEFGMELAEAQRDYARARLSAAAEPEAAPLRAGEDPTAAFNKIAQTVRRIVALQVRLTDDVTKRRLGLLADRTARRAKRAEEHAEAVRNTLEMALGEAFHADLPVPAFDPDAGADTPDPLDVERREMLDDAELLLEDLDDYGDWLNRPVGETAARLCVALGLPPDACVRRGDAWFVRRSPTAYENLQARKRGAEQSP